MIQHASNQADRGSSSELGVPESSANPIRVLCVDDNDLLADAIEMNLKLAGGFEWLGRLKSAGGLLKRCNHDAPDVVLLDIDMPGKDPFVALEQITESCPDVRVLMLTGLVRSDLIDRAIDAGAWGYISKNDGLALIPAIKRVVSGEFVLGPEAHTHYLSK